MGKLNKIIYLTGFYKMSVPIFGLGMHLFNSFIREQWTEQTNPERLKQRYGKSSDD